MRSRLCCGLAATLLVSMAARGTTLKPVRLDQAVVAASEVFVGTVIARKVVDGGPPRNLLFTDVTFGRLTTLKGERSTKSRTYRFAGGTRGKTTIRVDGVPGFVMGRRYLLLANAKIDALCPLVGWWQGCYSIGRDSRTGGEIVCDWAGRPVYGFEAGRPILRPRTRQDRPIRLAAFLSRLREILRKAGPRAPRTVRKP